MGHIETKAIGSNLDEIEAGKGPHGAQFIRYRDGLPNWILTDYLEFRWFVNGEKRQIVRLASLGEDQLVHSTALATSALVDLFEAFFRRDALTISSARELAHRLAGMTRVIRDLIIATFDTEDPSGLLHRWLTAFRQILIPDLAQAEFGDMLAQTIAYGLFAAWIHTPTGESFSRASAAFSLPRTNPFLRKLFSEIAGVDMPQSVDWAVDDVVELLRHTMLENVLHDFPHGQGKEDPVVHFYETFLNAYDPELRDLRGVFYTPAPVVGYIVRSIDHLLISIFNRRDGLADKHTLILDPAVGTATFLYFVIDHIKSRLAGAQAGAWDGYVEQHLLGRLFGFELLMAPYAVAHLKIGMQLEETGYRFPADRRLGVYLTNTLDDAMKRTEALFEKWISDEANEAAAIKRDKPILVVLGNPPYSGESANRSREADGSLTFIGNLIEDYKIVDGNPIREKVLKWLHNDYVKFIRFAQWRLDRTGQGIIGYVTSNSYLDNPTFAGMRQSLLKSFSSLYIYNLHGSTLRPEHPPQGRVDKNVFDIQQGVAILLGVKEEGLAESARVYYADLWGSREEKYAALEEEQVDKTSWTEIQPHSPSYWFVPVEKEFHEEYEDGQKVTDIFASHHSGIITKRDALAVHWTKEECFHVVSEFVSLSADAARERFNLPKDVRDWRVEWAQRDLRAAGLSRDKVIPILYRPFDIRYTYFTGQARGFLGWPVAEMTRLMLGGDNVALITSRMTKGERFQHVHASRQMAEVICLSSKTSNNAFVFPLYIGSGSEGERGQQSFAATEGFRQANFQQPFVETMSGIFDGELLSPEDIFSYILAFLHSPTYRRRYESFLARDFPRIPFTTSLPLFRALAAIGNRLKALHVLEEETSWDDRTTTFPISGSNVVENVRFDVTSETVSINQAQYFGNVSAATWDFFVGGYRVCEKWLKDRKGRKLTYDDLTHYQRIVAAVQSIDSLASTVDDAIEKFGGWPIRTVTSRFGEKLIQPQSQA